MTAQPPTSPNPRASSASPASVDPIGLLMSEHRLFERVLDALDAWVLSVEDGAPPGAELLDFTIVFSDFVDAHHHGKEEDLLFAAMVEAGFPSHGGPIAVMLHEHDLGRAHVRALRELVQRGDWSDASRAEAMDHARRYSALLRAHIRKEDHILYPMSRQILGASMDEVARRCAEYEETPAIRERADALLVLADKLVQRYAPPR